MTTVVVGFSALVSFLIGVAILFVGEDLLPEATTYTLPFCKIFQLLEGVLFLRFSSIGTSRAPSYLSLR